MLHRSDNKLVCYYNPVRARTLVRMLSPYHLCEALEKASKCAAANSHKAQMSMLPSLSVRPAWKEGGKRKADMQREISE